MLFHQEETNIRGEKSISWAALLHTEQIPCHRSVRMDGLLPRPWRRLAVHSFPPRRVFSASLLPWSLWQNQTKRRAPLGVEGGLKLLKAIVRNKSPCSARGKIVLALQNTVLAVQVQTDDSQAERKAGNSFSSCSEKPRPVS